MAARTFVDSTGVLWEVFEVHRASESPVAVSAGLEKGWLSFASGPTKRRLAPIPAGWLTATVPELERMCASARRASATEPARARLPQIRKRVDPSPTPSTGGVSAPAVSVEEEVRHFAHHARASGMPAVEAMVRLKALLLATFPDDASEARDRRRVRRWFVDAYYFDTRDL